MPINKFVFIKEKSDKPDISDNIIINNPIIPNSQIIKQINELTNKINELMLKSEENTKKLELIYNFITTNNSFIVSP